MRTYPMHPHNLFFEDHFYDYYFRDPVRVPRFSNLGHHYNASVQIATTQIRKQLQTDGARNEFDVLIANPTRENGFEILVPSDRNENGVTSIGFVQSRIRLLVKILRFLDDSGLEAVLKKMRTEVKPVR